jgi:pimeloyl-ACP methyl ester carboxylesterase
MTLELLKLNLPSNGATIAALDYEARRSRDVSLVVGHGYSSSKHNLDSLCAFLASHGFSVISVDFPGHKLGASGGRLNSLEDCVDTLAAAAEYARQRYGPTVYSLGHSMGAMSALRLAARDERIAGAISIATGWGRLAVLETLTQRGVSDLRASWVDGLTLPEILLQVEASNEATLAALAGRPVLYVAASRDMMVSPSSVQELYNRAPEPKKFEHVDSDHTYAGEKSRGTVLAWLNALHPRAS